MAATPTRLAWRRFRDNRPAAFGSLMMALLLGLTVMGPILTRSPFHRWAPRALLQSPTDLSEQAFAPPSADHWFGSDLHGRDLLSRVLYGGRISILVGLVGACVSLVIGTCWGATAAYAGGRIDHWMMRAVDILYALPTVVLVIVLMTLFEDLFQRKHTVDSDKLGILRLCFLFAGLGSVSWLTMSRIVRGEVLSLKERKFVEASRALGAGPFRILARHILPNASGVIVTYLALTIPSIILYESFLSYLGLGVRPPQASLGSLLAEGAAQINPIRVYWWMIVFPGGFLSSLLIALSLVGDGLRDALTPKG